MVDTGEQLQYVRINAGWEFLESLHCTNTDANTKTNSVSNANKYSSKYRDKDKCRNKYSK